MNIISIMIHINNSTRPTSLQASKNVFETQKSNVISAKAPLYPIYLLLLLPSIIFLLAAQSKLSLKT